MTKLYAPEGTGPYSVGGAIYEVVDGVIEVDNPEHVPELLTVGASATPLDKATLPYAARIPSEFGPTQEEHDALRAKYDALVLENENIMLEEGALGEALLNNGFDVGDEESFMKAAVRHLGACAAALAGGADDAPEPEAGADAADKTADESGGTSGATSDATALVDPGFTTDSDYRDILEWLKNNGAPAPSNISKAKALEAVAALLEANKQG